MSENQKTQEKPVVKPAPEKPTPPRPELKPLAAAAAENSGDAWLDAHIERANGFAEARQGAMAELPSSDFRQLVEAVDPRRLPDDEAREALNVYHQAAKAENYRGDPLIALPAEQYHRLVAAAA